MLRSDNRGMIKYNYVKKTAYQSQSTIAEINKQYIHKQKHSHIVSRSVQQKDI